ncbi:MAG: hypothetical protein IJC16_01850 [Rikenellaceae bacterium]|nr:hypothetical protein [Rikenellaceae bacterium]
MALALTASCVKEPAPRGEDTQPDAQAAAEVDRLTTTEAFDVPVRSGHITQVIAAGEVIAEAASPMTIQLPRGAAAARGEGGITCRFVPADEYPNVLTENRAKLYQVVCFEDSRSADYDYNDLVFHVKYQIRGNRFGFGIQPVALGSRKPIRLGCIVYKGDYEVFKGLLTPDGADCRTQYFRSQEGYVNTQGPEPNFFPRDPSLAGWREYLGSTIRCWDMSKYTASGAPRVEWYIVVDGGTELYALSTVYLDRSFDKEGLPYGLVITNTGQSYLDQDNNVCGFDWFNYPAENKHIRDVYPQLWQWLTTDVAYDFSDIYTAEVPSGAFPAADLHLFEVADLDLCVDKYLQN